MALSIVSFNGLKLLQITRSPSILNAIQNSRHRHQKHWLPKWKKLRREKVIKFKLPNFNEQAEDLTPAEIRAKMKERGFLPPRPWQESPMFISCTSAIFEPYVPPEGDGKKSMISMPGAKQKFEFLEKKSKSMLAVRKIRSYDEEFDPPVFAEEATEIYRNAHEAMCEKDFDKLIKYVTERAYPEIIHNIENKTLRWKFLGSLEPPRVVHARCTDVITPTNIFTQITVRLHTQQQLSIYDRFGRLMHGSEILAKDVLEYVVFEKHLSNQYGVWRLHDKIVPDWLEKPEPAAKTFVKRIVPEETVKENVKETQVQKT